MSAHNKTGFFANLDPIDGISEAIFGIVMTLTFTSVMSVNAAAETEVRKILYAALSCNLAWGLIDCLMYLVTAYVEEGRTLFRFRTLAHKPYAESSATIRDKLHARAGIDLTSEQTASVIAVLNEDASTRKLLDMGDVKAAIGVFLTASLAGLPISLPFLLIDDLHLAMRWSNAVGVLLLFASGFALGRQMGLKGWMFGLVFAAVGSVITAITIQLGG